MFLDNMQNEELLKQEQDDKLYNLEEALTKIEDRLRSYALLYRWLIFSVILSILSVFTDSQFGIWFALIPLVLMAMDMVKDWTTLLLIKLAKEGVPVVTGGPDGVGAISAIPIAILLAFLGGGHLVLRLAYKKVLFAILSIVLTIIIIYHSILNYSGFNWLQCAAQLVMAGICTLALYKVKYGAKLKTLLEVENQLNIQITELNNS